MLGAKSDGAQVARRRGVAAARLRSIKAQIIADIGSRDLTLSTVASRNRISTAYVRKLFEAEGTTFTEFVLSQRLTTAYRMLTNVRFANRSISSIAWDADFNDQSYFNRTFRRAFGVSPSEVRGEAARGG
jgi:AraC-like DNA-binding protein